MYPFLETIHFVTFFYFNYSNGHGKVNAIVCTEIMVAMIIIVPLTPSSIYHAHPYDARPPRNQGSGL